MQLSLLPNAYEIAVLAHEGQKRDNGEPFINHPLRVARKTAEIIAVLPRLIILDPYYHDEVMAAAVLHDAIEDTDRQLPNMWANQIKSLNKNVYDLTMMLTKPSSLSSFDPKSMSVQERKKMDLEHLKKAVKSAIIIKRADREDNLYDAKCWNTKRKLKYIAETENEILPTILSKLTHQYEYRPLEKLAEETEIKLRKAIDFLKSTIKEGLENDEK